MKWISIQERLPEENRPVLLFTPFEYFGELHSCVGNAESIRCCTVDSGTVKKPVFTHWVPLPENPGTNNHPCDR